MMNHPQGTDRQLDVLIERLSPLAENPAARALLIEARRLKSIMDNWRSVPPAAHLRDEMLARVMHLSAAVNDLAPPPPSIPTGPRIAGGTMIQQAPAGPYSQAGRGFGGPSHSSEETIITEGLSALPQTPLDVHPVKITSELSHHLPVLKDPFSKRADAYRALRHQLAKRGDPKVVGVTSAERKEGKTTAAINLAASLREGARGRVLVLEANLRAPALATMLGFMPPVCFQEQLSIHRRDPLEPWVAAEIMPSLHAMAVNPMNKYPPLIDPIGFSIAIDRLRLAGYDYIVVDTSPVLESADVNLIADSVDGFIMTTLARRTNSRSVRRGIAQLGSVSFLGTVLLE